MNISYSMVKRSSECSTKTTSFGASHNQQGEIMEFKTFVRRPFQVQAVEITEENMAEIAEMIGGKIKDFESESGETGSRYIQLNRQIIPNVGKALIGWW